MSREFCCADLSDYPQCCAWNDSSYKWRLLDCRMIAVQDRQVQYSTERRIEDYGIIMAATSTEVVYVPTVIHSGIHNTVRIYDRASDVSGQ